MQNRKKMMGLAATAGLALGGLSASAAVLEVADLSITVNTTAHTWSAFEQNSNPANTSGLHGMQFTVSGSGGVTITGSTVKLPSGFDADSSTGNGFQQLRINGVNGVNISAYQNNTSATNTPGSVNTIYQGVGNVAENVPVSDDGSNDPLPGVITTKAIALPVQIASGTYTGSAGTLTVNAVASAIDFLPVTMPTPTTGGVAFQTFPASGVVPGSFTIPVPEPASMGLLALGLGGLTLRRRR